MVSKFSLCVLSGALTLSAYASNFVLSLSSSHDYVQLHSRSTFHLFDDGRYVLKTNTGVAGLCTASAVGQFVGTLKPAELTEVRELMKQGQNNCKGLDVSACTLQELTDNNGVSWWISDLTGKKKQTAYFRYEEKTPEQLKQIVRKLISLETTPTSGLTFTAKNKDTFVFRYTGETPLQLNLGPKNFYLVDETGEVKLLSKFSEPLTFPKSQVYLKNGQSWEMHIHLKKPTGAQGWRLIYDSSAGENPVGHSDLQLTPCVIL